MKCKYIHIYIFRTACDRFKRLVFFLFIVFFLIYIIYLFFCSVLNRNSNNENLIELTKNSTQNEANVASEERENDEDTSDYWNQQINEAFFEYNALRAKYSDKMKQVCKESTEYYEERPKCISYCILNYPAEKRMEKLLSFRDDILKRLQGFLAIRGISKKNQNSRPGWF